MDFKTEQQTAREAINHHYTFTHVEAAAPFRKYSVIFDAGVAISVIAFESLFFQACLAQILFL